MPEWAYGFLIVPVRITWTIAAAATAARGATR
jgi:hypothetical protein